ncbi:pectinesterase family protein [Alkalitalea saponilacus]|uniref:Pectinesterase n=1 Tax=Alkalitalea saponilacus TaxID=889453 RepID=A0A1T5HSJ0_9BACT|nr:pectinesterase family protein [Alkalitalea saponilacus]ASB48375.1 pectin esterase [Alkalitalea saponilacus]SKC23607.1 pectinesterase [Alkalitalea saponilacus]
MTLKHFANIIVIFIFSISCAAQSTPHYDFIVAQDNTGDFTSIQEAINVTKAFPDEPVTIFIKNGVYKEKVRVYSWNTKLTLMGESTENTIITYDDYFDKINLGRNSTFHTYTLKVEANDFTAKNLTIENSAGPVGQAVALHVEGDRCSFINCRFLGHQDTVYSAGEGRRHYFYQCYIDGTTDFIFGEGTAVFQDCQIHSKSNSYITAASTPENIPYGFVFIDCNLTAEEDVDKVFLGRPWRDYARTVFMNCELGSHIRPEGWSNWSGTNRDESAFYAEYGNTGPGANTSNRASWAMQLTEEEAKHYTIENIFRFGIGEWLFD